MRAAWKSQESAIPQEFRHRFELSTSVHVSSPANIQAAHCAAKPKHHVVVKYENPVQIQINFYQWNVPVPQIFLKETFNALY